MISEYFVYCVSGKCNCANKSLTEHVDNCIHAFSALTLLVGWQEGPVKNWMFVFWWWWFDWSFGCINY